MIFIIMRMKNNFHIKGWALNLVLIQRPGEILIGRCFGSEIGVGKSGWFLALASLFQALRLEGLARGEERSETDKTKQKHGCEEMGEKTVKSTLPSPPLFFSSSSGSLVRVFCPGWLSVSLAMDSCQICILQSDNKKYGKYIIEKIAYGF